MNVELWLDAAEFLAVLMVFCSIWIAFLFGLIWLIDKVIERK